MKETEKKHSTAVLSISNCYSHVLTENSATIRAFTTKCLLYFPKWTPLYMQVRICLSQCFCPAMSVSMYINTYVRSQLRSDRVKSVRIFFPPASAYSDVAVRFCHRQTSVGFHSLLVYIFRYKAAGCIGSR